MRSACMIILCYGGWFVLKMRWKGGSLSETQVCRATVIKRFVP
jgi:hypothetical protein